jgi:hypothetical protein
MSAFAQDSTNPLLYTALFTPDANGVGVATVGVASGKFTDAAGNNNQDTYLTGVSGTTVETNNQVAFQYSTDSTPPTIAITRAGSGTVTGTETVRFTLSEASSTFDASDVTVTGGSLSAFAQDGTNPLLYTATFTPASSSSGTASISVADNKFSDAAGNFNADGADTNNTLSLPYSTSMPTVAITRASSNTLGAIGSTQPTETVTFTLSEVSTDFVQGDVTLSSGSLSNWTAVSATQYTATFTPAANATGTATIGVDAGKFSNAAGNLNQDTYVSGQGSNTQVDNQVSVVYDTVVPTQTVSFGSMTKDSGVTSLATANKDWTTNDSSAGRLVSGFISAPLGAGEVVNVYANSTLIGTASVAAGGTTWAITDLKGYGSDPSWTYTANVVDAAGNAAPMATQVVNLDTSTLAAPVITSVGTDATFATVVAHNGSTSDNTLVVKGTGVPGSFITLYDNNSGYAVQSGVLVNSSGEWTADLTATPLFNGTHNFFAVQSNAQGVVSPLSNPYTASVLLNLVSNGSFESPVVTAGTYGTTLSGSNLPSWTISSGTVDVMAENFSYGALGVSPTTPAGTQLLDMDGVSAGTIYQDISNLVVGQTYAWSFAYAKFLASGDQLKFDLTGAGTVSTTYTPTSSTLTTVNGTFVATTSSVRMTFTNIQGGGTGDAGVALDNIVLSRVDLSAPTVDGSLTAGATLGGATSAANSMNYGGGVLESLAGNDTITVTLSNLQNTLTAGALIDGGAGVDTLKLAAGTTLDLTALTGNQTVKPIEQVEVFELQGSSALTLSANNVLSLGGTNTGTTVGTSTAASPMAPYSFASTTGVSGVTTSSANKVQMVVTGTTTDALNLNTLALDGVTSNGVVGNTGLGGEWVYKGTASINNVTYKVYDHSTTQAQVLTTLTASTESAAVGFTSMTKDSSLVLANADWYTADGSAGRLVSGTLAEPLPAGGFVKIYANGTLLGNATVNAAGTAWAYTDTAGYNANWEYRADVVTSSGTTIASAVQQVFLIVEPTITSVLVDSYTTSDTTENFSNYTAGSTVGPNFTITGRNGAQAGSGGSGALFHNTNDLLGGGMAIHFAKGQNQNTAAVGEILITKNTGDMYSLSFQYTDLQFGAKTIKLYAADGSVVNTFSLSNYSGTFSTGLQTQPFTSIGISGGNQDFWIMDNFSFAVPSVTAGGQVSLAANSTFLDTTPVLQGTTGRALAAGETIRIFDGATDLGAATVTGTNWTFNTTLPAGSTKTYTASIVSASGQVLQTSAGFAATQSGSATLTPTSNLPTSAAETVAYTGSSLDALGGNDTITAGTSVQTWLATGGMIDGGQGVDTLKLAAGTVLDLDHLTRNQTVKAVQEVEIFQLQGGSSLSMSANNVLSLGGSNASTMTGFSFNSTSAGSGAGYNSTGKVQLVVNATNTDQVKLTALQLDGVLDDAGLQGNTGLAGQWSDVGMTTIGGVSYQVFNHSTTQAQVLVSNATVALPTNSQTVAITSAAVNSTSFVQEFVDPLVPTSKAQKSVTTNDGNWTISATGANGQTLPTIDANNGNVGYYVSIGERWAGLSGTELNLGEQTTQQISGGRREYKFTSNVGEFDFVEFRYTDVNFTNDLWINFYDAAGNLIDRTAFTAVNVTNSLFTYNIKDGALANSFMIDMNTDDTWGLDKLTTGIKQSAAKVFSGASIMDATPLLAGAYSGNLAVGEVIAVYDGSTKLGNATIDPNTKTWIFQTTTDLSATAHTFTAKVETSTGTATATSSNFALTLLSSPLALDLNGDGVHTVGIEQGVQFDLLTTGSAQNVGWLDGQDGWLALDLDGNGRIDNGAELLGSNTRLADGSLARDGWQALAQHDGNADGVIDVNDEVFLDLKVWVDANSNGQTEEGELRSLADHQIVRLDLNYAAGETAQNGNILQGLSSYTTTDGQSHQMVDAWLKVEEVLSSTDPVLGAIHVTTDEAAQTGELLQLNQLLNSAPKDGLFPELLPVLVSSPHNALLHNMLELHSQNPLQS